MNRRDRSPGRGARARVAETPHPEPDDYPDADYDDGEYLDAHAYPVDPGYQGYTDGPRPADMPTDSLRTRPERFTPPRNATAPRRQVPRDSDLYDRPWQRPEGAPPGVGRPRPPA
ncbi:MAG: hypothetical protein ACRDN0_23525, partial [Trebonia sp.]